MYLTHVYNASYLRERPTVLVPIRGDTTQTSGDMLKNKNTNSKYKDQKESFYLLDMFRRTRRSLLLQPANEGAPRSCPGQK